MKFEVVHKWVASIGARKHEQIKQVSSLLEALVKKNNIRKCRFKKRSKSEAKFNFKNTLSFTYLEYGKT